MRRKGRVAVESGALNCTRLGKPNKAQPGRREDAMWMMDLMAGRAGLVGRWDRRDTKGFRDEPRGNKW